LAFMLASLRSLAEDIEACGSTLVVRRGKPQQVLGELVSEGHAGQIFAEEDFSPYAKRRDAEIINQLPVRFTHGLTVQHPDWVKKADGDPYTVFTPFSRAWKALAPPSDGSLLPPPAGIPTPTGLTSEPLPERPVLPDEIPFSPGEGKALRRLQAFTEGDDAPVYSYHHQRNRVDLQATSGLSPYLRFGMLSARQAIVAARAALERAPKGESRKGAETWLQELIWREFFIAILHHFPQVREESFRTDLRSIRWVNDETQYQAWTQGCTGYPIVDAAMRQLMAIGWMHNRARMVVASFLVKDLLIDWRWGEYWFMQHLIDGDPSANNGGWQWSAGTGTDAAPYFRVFNPTLQGAKHDPEGDYIRRWIPELSAVPTKRIHQPWKMTEAEQRDCGVVVGKHYPAPIIDHGWARERILAEYKRARQEV
jgi:deoxyribodipyrimidine photo-lyase